MAHQTFDPRAKKTPSQKKKEEKTKKALGYPRRVYLCKLQSLNLVGHDSITNYEEEKSAGSERLSRRGEP